MKIENGKEVTLEFELRDDKGNLLDKTTKGDELVFIYGEEPIVAGLEEELLNKKSGQKFKVRVTPKKGYGNYDEELTQTMDLSAFDGIEIYEGYEFEADTDDGAGIFTIKEIDLEEEKVIIDGNHPFAGMVLIFTGRILEVK
jgi:FKBP-type peptidyl-prolyl cis-trans isomerase SlyD